MNSFYYPREKGFAPSKRNIHPEVKDLAEQVLKRDLIAMRHLKVSHFIREPYGDLNEIEMIPELGEKAQDIFGIYVLSMVKDLTNARIPVTKEQFDELRETTKFIGQRA
jgi:hypothetical protein